MKIDEVFINALKHCESKYRAAMLEINQYEKIIDETKKKLEKWAEENKEKIEHVTNKEVQTAADVDLLEEQVNKYEKIIHNLTDEMRPYIEKVNNIKKEITELYEKIMKKYGEKYTEDEIIKVLRTQLNINKSPE